MRSLIYRGMIMNCHRITGHNSGRRVFCLLLFAMILIGWAAPVYGDAVPPALNASGAKNLPVAVDPFEDEEGYSAILYDNRNGVPTSEANAIAQTDEGFLWIGTYAGLIRYDGNNFERIESDEGILNTRCLYTDSRGRLWIGTNDFGLFLMIKDRFRSVDHAEQTVSVSIRSIAEDSEGLIYVGSAAGVFTVDDELKVSVLSDERLSSQTIAELRSGSDGLIYGITQEGDLFLLKHGALLSFLTHEDCGLAGIDSLLPDPVRPGLVYLAYEDSGTKSAHLCHGSPEDAFASAEILDVGPLSNVERMELIGGEIWLCAGNGIGKWDGVGLHRLNDVPMDKSVGHVMTDYEGNLWFTSSRQCLMKIVPNRFLDLFGQYALPEDVVNSTCMLDGQLFIGTDDSGLIVLKDGKRLDRLPLTSAATASGTELDIPDLLDYLKNERIRSVIRDSRGRLWICTWRHQTGLLRYDRGELVTFTKADGLFSDQVRTVSECADGTILAAQPEGVSVIRGDSVTACYGAEDGISVPSILTLTEGFHHELILGSDGGGIYVVEPDGLRHIGTENGLKSEVVLRIRRSSFRNLFWIATGNSLAYMTPDYQVTTIDDFPYSNNYDFYESSTGDLWVLSSNGIYVVSVDEMLQNESVSAVFYGIPDGLPYIATSNSFSELTDDGDLYIAGVKGSVRVNIQEPFGNSAMLRIALPWIDIDGKRSYPDASGAYTFPRDAKKLTIYPYVFSYALTDPQISYRLEGFDTADITVRRSELTPVTYTNLRGGTYRFLIRAEDPGGETGIVTSCRLNRAKALFEGSYGSIILDAAALVMLGGVWVYTSLFRKRGRISDRLLLFMLLTNAVMAVMEPASYLQEGTAGPFARPLMIAETCIFYAALELYPYLFLLYVDYIAHPDASRLRKVSLYYAIPFVLFLVLLAVNLKTGWIFSINENNTFRSGPYDQVLFIPLLLYFLIALLTVRRVDPRLALIGVLLLGIRVLWDLWYVSISSISFVYALFLVYTYMYVLGKSVKGGIAG